MEIPRTNNNIALNDEKTIKSTKNQPVENNGFNFKDTPGSKDTLTFSVINENHDMHWYSKGNDKTYGLRFEQENKFCESENGIIKMYNIVGDNITMGRKMMDLEVQRGVKIKAGYKEVANAYISGCPAMNAGLIDGDFTGGIGIRGAVGAVVGPFYGECFKEISTNYNSDGYTVGLKILY